MSKAGFVAVVGRPNAGKSTIVNHILGEKILMVSQKANATRKRSNAIVMHGDDQIIFIDTPGIHKKEKLLNQFMLDEALKAIGDCDLLIYLAPVTDSTEHYEEFLALNKAKKKHIIVLSKIDQVPQDKLLKKILSYNAYANEFEALIPFSVNKSVGSKDLLDTIVQHLEVSPPLYDPEDLTDQLIRNIYKEFIRESIFDNISDEIPYESDVIIDSIEESPTLDKIRATIIIEKESQKPIIVGKGGEAIKRIGINARKKIEQLSHKKVFLELFVSVKKGWTNNKEFLEEIGYKQ